MAETKVETFIGFCVRARKITLGSGAIATLKRGVFAIIFSSDAAKNTKKLAEKYSRKFNCPLIICYSSLERAVNKEGCKIAAVCDRNLAQAILNSLNGDYRIYVGGSD